MHGVVKKLLRLNLRCLFLQLCWNFRVFQGIGSTWIMLPWRQNEVCPPAENSRAPESSAGRIGYFNTNVFCAPTVLAAQLSLHEKQEQGEYVVIGADEFTAAVMAPVAAVGDALFWGGLRPLAALTAVILTLLGLVWAPLAVVLLFTLPTTLVRLGGSILGYVRGAQVVALIQQLHLANFAVRVKQSSMVLLGVISALAWHKISVDLNTKPAESAALAGAVLVLIGVSIWLLRHKIPVVVILGMTLMLFCSAGCLV
jgi:PTS system mannose-specific IID component